jgi:hypothetical protein
MPMTYLNMAQHVTGRSDKASISRFLAGLVWQPFFVEQYVSSMDSGTGAAQPQGHRLDYVMRRPLHPALPMMTQHMGSQIGVELLQGCKVIELEADDSAVIGLEALQHANQVTLASSSKAGRREIAQSLMENQHAISEPHRIKCIELDWQQHVAQQPAGVSAEHAGSYDVVLGFLPSLGVQGLLLWLEAAVHLLAHLQLYSCASSAQPCYRCCMEPRC